jgi:hypothetical protein
VKKLFATAFKNMYVSQDLFRKIIPIVIPQTAHQALGTCFHVRFLSFTPPLCGYSCIPSTWDLQFSSASQVGVSATKLGSWFRLREVETSFKEFLASPARMRFQVLKSFFLLQK